MMTANHEWHDRAFERIEARRRKIAGQFADETDFLRQEELWNESACLARAEVFLIACKRIAANELTGEELARAERIRPLFAAVLQGKSWKELTAMKTQLGIDRCEGEEND